MILVLDASAAAPLVTEDSDARDFRPIIDNADWVLAPSIYVSEICNVFWKYHAFRSADLETCEQAITLALDLPDTISDDRELCREAFSMACRCNTSVYDMLYLVLARRHSATLLTMDKALRKLAHNHDVTVG